MKNELIGRLRRSLGTSICRGKLVVRDTVARLFLWVLTFSLIPCVAVAAEFDEPMVFKNGCMAASFHSCGISATGKITKNTPQEFEKFLAGSDGVSGDKIFLHSPGGTLIAGLELGRLIRKHGLRTTVMAVNYSTFEESYGICASACAYAFMGGVKRGEFGDSGKIGVHRFYNHPDEIGSTAVAQLLSADLLLYTIEMDVDPRFLRLPANVGPTDLHYVSEDEARKYNLYTSSEFGDVFLEPYKDGVVAAAKRQTDPTSNDFIYQITTFCRSGANYILYTGALVPSEPAELSLSLDGRDFEIAASAVTSEVRQKLRLLEVELPTDVSATLSATTSFYSTFGYSVADGGFYPVALKISEMGQKMIKSSFSHCIR